MSDSNSMFSWRKAILKSGLPPTTRHVLLTLACHMNEAGESCFPSIKLLCEETGLSNRAVITHLQNATELGWITVGKHGFGGQRWAAHEYRPAWPHHLRKVADALEKAVNVVHHDNQKAVNVVHVLDEKAVNVVPKGGEPNDEKAVKEVHSSNPYSSSVSASETLPDQKSGEKKPITDTELQAACRATWNSYSEVYAKRYGAPPLRNAQTNTAIKSFCKRIPHEEAPQVAAFFVSLEDPFYLQSMHSAALMLKNAEGLRTRWATGKIKIISKSEKFDPVAFVNKNAIKRGVPSEKLVN